MQKGIELAKEAVEEDNKQNWTQVSGPGAQLCKQLRRPPRFMLVLLQLPNALGSTCRTL